MYKARIILLQHARTCTCTCTHTHNHTHLLPHVPARIVDVHVEAVVGAKHDCITAWVESTGRELSHSVISTVVKRLKGAPTGIVKYHLSVGKYVAYGCWIELQLTAVPHCNYTPECSLKFSLKWYILVHYLLEERVCV